ncbi:transmembrane protein 267 [Bicyclus anynana]|uniref:Transmembrane protein 267 n=1 Tax=Bicyclus anynana TaxID=110368 RepID=A0A6J1NYU3_BICAN|nr:transmembrane protein 267 [Bicyclus anynana]
MRLLSIILTLSICGAAYMGDYIVFNSKYSSNQMFRAFADTSVHGVIGLLSALLFFSHGMNVTTQAWVCNTLICFLVSAFIDIDHVIVAKSFNLKDIANVNRRGMFHDTSFCTIMSSILLAFSHFTRKQNIYLLTYMIILAFTSHHIRDGNRRGIWFYPYAHTQPLGKCVYVFLICVLPSFLAFIFNYTKPVFSHRVIQYGMV